jgi:hypothetical protein
MTHAKKSVSGSSRERNLLLSTEQSNLLVVTSTWLQLLGATSLPALLTKGEKTFSPSSLKSVSRSSFS